MNSTDTRQEATGGSSVPILLGILLVSVLLFSTRRTSQQEVRALDARPELSGVGQIPGSPEQLETSTNVLTQTVHGQKVAYTLVLPEGWTTQSVTMDRVDNLSASRSNLNVAVMVEETKTGTTAEAAEEALSTLRASATDFYSSKPEKVILDGHDWVKFVVKCRIERQSMGYQYYVYSGLEGTYQIVAWTELLNFERNLRLMRTIIQSFRFPPAPKSQGSTTLPEEGGPITVSTRGAVP